MFCEQCGKKLPDGARFCPNCGTPVPQDDENIETQNGGMEEHVENVEEPIVEEKKVSDNFETPEEPKNHTRLTKKAKIVISSIIAVVIIGAVGITAGINTKQHSQAEKKVAKKEKAVKEDKKAETKKEPKVEEEKPKKEVTLKRVEDYELSGLLTDACIALGRQCKNWEDRTITPDMVEYEAESDENIEFTSITTGEWNFEEIAKDMRFLLDQASYAKSFNVSVSKVTANFNTPYKYEKENAEDLRLVNKIEFSAMDKEMNNRKSVDIYVDTKYELVGSEWLIADIVYLGKNNISADGYNSIEASIPENNQNHYFMEGDNMVVFDTNLKPLLAALNPSDIDTYYTLYRQIIENEAENWSDADYIEMKYSLAYLNDDDIPELLIWLFDKNMGENHCIYPFIYYVGDSGLYKKLVYPANGSTDNLTYIPKGKKLLCKTSDSDFDTTWKEYEIWQRDIKVLKDTVIDRQESGNGHNQFSCIKGERASEEEILNYIANTGINTTFDIYDSLEDAISNL